MQTIERVAMEVRESTGLFGSIDAKVLAVWMGLELDPVTYPCECRIVDRGEPSRVRVVVYYGEAGEAEAQAQIAAAVCARLLSAAGMECPRARDIERLASLLCGCTPVTDAA